MDFSQSLLDRIKAPNSYISKSSCLQMFYKDAGHQCWSFLVIKLQALSLRLYLY